MEKLLGKTGKIGKSGKPGNSGKSENSGKTKSRASQTENAKFKNGGWRFREASSIIGQLCVCWSQHSMEPAFQKHH